LDWLKDGGILLSVHSDDSQWTEKAKQIMQQTGAQEGLDHFLHLI
jgi:hypothetical protein